MASAGPTTQEQTSLASLRQTPLHALHRELGAKFVPFAGYEMPVSYPEGIIAEHHHTRAHASLFDVSHMGQALVSHREDAAVEMERLVPGDIAGLQPGRMRYTQLVNEQGGIIDDLMITRLGRSKGREWLFLVVNAARKETDFAHIAAHLTSGAQLDILPEQALLALQGPEAGRALSRLLPTCREMAFMSMRFYEDTPFDALRVSRSGYTGEDGFEISVAADKAEALARALLEDVAVKPAGLGARDTLRLEAGLCLYGHDIDETTSPVEAALSWSIGKRRRAEGGFPGAARILEELKNGPKRLRVGLRPVGRAIPREGTPIRSGEGTPAGQVTSGAFGPTVGGPVAMGYVAASLTEPGTEVLLSIRGRETPAQIASLPFVPHRYYVKRKK